MMPSLMSLTEAQIAELRRLASHSRVEALVLLRSITGCGLREAVDALATLALAPAPAPRDPDPAPVAELYAFGAYSPAVAEFLDYGAELYAGVRAGTAVSVVVSEASGLAAIDRLAACLGGAVVVLNSWAVSPERIDVAALAAADLAEAQRVEGLRAAGFAFHFAIDRHAGS